MLCCVLVVLFVCVCAAWCGVQPLIALVPLVLVSDLCLRHVLRPCFLHLSLPLGDCRGPWVVLLLRPVGCLFGGISCASRCCPSCMSGPFRRFFYRGHEVKNLLDLTEEEITSLLHSRARRNARRTKTHSRASTHLLNRLNAAVCVRIFCAFPALVSVQR